MTSHRIGKTLKSSPPLLPQDISEYKNSLDHYPEKLRPLLEMQDAWKEPLGNQPSTQVS